MENGVRAWSFTFAQYVKAAVQNVKYYLKTQKSSLPTKAKVPMSPGYRPELDTSPELKPQEAAYYQSLIGILRWIVELGRSGICVEVSMLASHMILPRRGHLDQIYHIFAYLNNMHNSEIVFDHLEPENPDYLFEGHDWKDTVYGNCSEILPNIAPESRRYGFIMRAFVDSDHVGDSITRRSRTGSIIYLNSSPVYYSSKKQTSVETSSFGSECITMKICCEYIRGLRYKLRMMGIPDDSPTYIYGNNQSVLTNSSMSYSVLKKKSCSIAYHILLENELRKMNDG